MLKGFRSGPVALVLFAASALVGCLRPGDGEALSPEEGGPDPRANSGQYAPQEQPQASQQPGPYGGPAWGPDVPRNQPAQPNYGPPPGQYGPPQGGPPAYPVPAVIPQQSRGEDPINILDQAWMRSDASSVLVELINALPPSDNRRVRDIPLNADPTVGEVNAFAACEKGVPLMAVSDGLLQVTAWMSQLKATDEVFGTHKLEAYLNHFARNQRPHQPIVSPAPGTIDERQSNDHRKIARQHVLFDEQLAFVLGHELAHHYMGHTGCANGQRGASMSPFAVAGHVASKLVPTFNQPNELIADGAGTSNLLSAGKRRNGAKWNEEGAMMTLDFFTHIEGNPRLSDIINSHPNSMLRRNAVGFAASSWRQTGGAGVPLPRIPNIFGM